MSNKLHTSWFPSLVINWTPMTGLIPCQVQPRPAHEPWYPFSCQKPQKNGTLMAMAGGKVGMYSSWLLYRTCIILQMLYHRVEQCVHCAILWKRMILCSTYYVWLLSPHPTSGSPAFGYKLDTYYWIFTMPSSARTCSWAMVPLQ